MGDTFFKNEEPLKKSDSDKFFAIKKIHTMLEDIRKDIKSAWPIIPRKNLLAGGIFLKQVLMHIELIPETTVDECVLLVVAQYKKCPSEYSDIIFMQPNFFGFNFSVFKQVLNFTTPVGEYIAKIEKLTAERIESAPVQAIPGEGRNESSPLLSSDDRIGNYQSVKR